MQMRQVGTVLMVGLLLGCAPGPAGMSRASHPGWQLYSNEKYGYQIEYPEGYALWETGAPGDRDGATIRIGLKDYESAVPMLDVQVAPRTERNQFPSLGLEVPRLRVEMGDVLINGVEAKEARYYWREGGELAFAEVYVDGAVLRFDAISGLGDFRKTPWWDIITTFRIIPR